MAGSSSPSSKSHYLQLLKELGSKFDIIVPTSKDSLIKLLKQATTYLAELDQSPLTTTRDSMNPFFNAIVKPELLKHQDKDVKLLVATCICEITRITAPEAPYNDEILKDTFRLIVSTFSGLSDTSGPSFGRRVVILETLAKYRSCVVMLDLECDDLVNEMFSTFVAVARDDHPESVLSSMQTIMVVLLEESEDVHGDLLSILLSTLGRGNKGVTMAAKRLAMNVIQHCVGKLESSIKQLLLSLMSGDSKLVNSQIEYHGIIYDLYCCAPQILSGVLPYVTGELLTDQLETRLKAMNLVGDMISIPGTSIPEAFQPIFSEFLKRLSDRVVEVRMSAIEHVKNCLLLNPFRAEASQILSALCERLLDFDENVRKKVVAVICDVACHALNAIPLETVKLVAERLRDKSLLVKKYTMERLAEVHRVFCENSCETVKLNEYDWIPGKIVRCFYDKDFRSDIIESVLCGSVFPVEFSTSDIVKRWVEIFSGFDKVEVKALEKILEQKQRLQQEMQKYLSLRQKHQDKDVPEVQKKIRFCFKVMSHSFGDPIKAEENFQFLEQLTDANIWKILANLVDPNTSLHQARAYRDDLLKILGVKHPLYEFLNTFSMKCSYLLFNKEHVKAILEEIVAQKSAENAQRTQSCMDLLVIIARFCPLVLSGSEEELVNLLKDNNDIIKVGVLNVLAKAGATLRKQLSATASSVDLILERLCLEGSRRQAKYAVHALAAITKDDGLMSLSVLYKKLVDMLEENTHLPAVLQSLGCIAQNAIPVFETRESEIKEFITNKILKSDGKEDHTRTSWDDKSDLCMLKIYGIKTLVKSYLPFKDAHVRPDIDSLLDILRNMLSYGEQKNTKLSVVVSVSQLHYRMSVPNAAATEDLSSEMEVDAFRRLFPLRYFERHLAESIRSDGRPLREARDTSIFLGAVASANGSALVKIGSTTMLTAIKMEVMTPSLESPDEGCLAIDFHMPPICSPIVRPGRPAEAEPVVSKQLSDTITSSGMIDLRELSLVGGKAAWMAYLDIYCLDADGSLFDAALLSAVAALSHLQIPAVAMNDDGKIVLMSDEDGQKQAKEQVNKEKRKLTLKSIPLSLTCILHKNYILADPTAEEESIVETHVTIVLDTSGQLISLYKPGGPVLAYTSAIQDCVALTRQRVKELKSFLDKENSAMEVE